MKIFPVDRNSIVIGTRSGNVHVYEEDGKVCICYYNHVSIEIVGTSKNCPTVTVDSDEFPTNLVVKETESKWLKQRVEP